MKQKTNKKGQFIKGFVPWNKGIPHSKATKQKISKAIKENLPKNLFKKGHKHSEAIKKKISEAKKGKHYPKISQSKIGNKHTEATKRKMSKAHTGRKLSKKQRINSSIIRRGDKSHFWKGGISSVNEKIRNGIDFRLWREAVFARDNWICQKTEVRGGKLHPHHIKNFADYPELRFAIDNGITFSEKAHREFHKIYGVRNNTQKQLEEFLR